MKDISSGGKVNHPFTAPKGYFDAFPQQVQRRVHATASSKLAWPIWALRLAFPALAIGIGLGWWISYSPNSSDTVATSQATEQILQEVTPEEIGKYLLDEDISEHEIYEVATIKTIDLQSEEDELLEEIDLEDLL